MNEDIPSAIPHTVAPVRLAETYDPEFVDYKGLAAIFGIKRSLAYQLLADGKIASVSLRRRGQARGKRLFVVDSVRTFLKDQMKRGI